MTPAFVRELEELLTLSRPAEPRPRLRSLPSPTYGPMTEPVAELLDRARSLTPDEIERLAVSSRRLCRGQRYAEALLAMRQAAEVSGRSRMIGLAGTEAQQLVMNVADQRIPAFEVDDARWHVVGQQAAWAAGDAARALVVRDVLPEPHLRELTSAWTTLAGA